MSVNAVRKKKPRAPRPSAAQQFSVVVEDVRSQFKGFGEALQGLRSEVAAGFDDVRAEFASVRAEVALGFEQVDRRFEQVDRRFEQVDREIGLVKAAVLEHGHELKEIRSSVRGLEGNLARKVDREEVEAIVDRIARPRSR
jgi:hypothetical protein